MKKVLVAMDRSEQSLGALRYITRLLPAEKIEVVLFMVMTKLPETYWDITQNHNGRLVKESFPVLDWVRAREKEADEFMLRARQLATDAGVTPERITIRVHDKDFGITRDILAEAERDNYRAVVIGRTGRSKLKDFILGSTAHKIIQHIGDIPIWVVGGAPMAEKILVAVDTSKAALRVVDYAGEMLGGSGVKLTLFHASRELGIYRPNGDGTIERQHEAIWANVIKEKMHIVFEESLKRLVDAGVHRDDITIKFESGVVSRAAAIIKEAQTGNYGTIFAGRRGLSEVNRFMLGRVTNKLIQYAGEMAVCVVD